MSGANRSSSGRDSSALSTPAPVGGDASCPFDPGRDGGRRLAALAGEQLVDVRALDGDPQIEPVEQWAREPPDVPLAARLVALARPRWTTAARTGIGRRHQEEPGGQLDVHIGAGHVDDSRLEWLAEGVEDADRELAELVHEQDAPVREADLAGPQRARTTTDEGDDGARVVW